MGYGAVNAPSDTPTVLTESNIAVRHSVSESTTTTISPAAGEQHQFIVVQESGVAATTPATVSANRTNDVQVGGMENGNAGWIRQFSNGSFSGAMLGYIHANSASDFEWITPATVGTYIWQRIGKIVS